MNTYEQYIPYSSYPDQLDSNRTLLEVFNTSESLLNRDFILQDQSIFIVPREWEEKEKWSFENGILNIEGDIVYYNSVSLETNPSTPPAQDPRYNFFSDPSIPDEEKNKYRRIISFNGIVRLSPNQRSHFIGEWVRGYVMAEHHNLLAKSIFGIQELIGIDNSQDIRSIDFRLRDLQELQIEPDDFDCPYGVYWYEILEQDNFIKKVQFHITIIGEFNSFDFVPKEGQSPISDNLNPIITYNINDLISPSLTVRKTDCCSCISESTTPCEPCEFDAAIDDLPILDCPIIDPFEVPSFNCETDLNLECPTCTPCTTTTFPEFPTIPETISVIGFPTEIIITVPEITIPAITTAIDVNVNVTWAGQQSDDGQGACFRLLPCQGTTS